MKFIFLPPNGFARLLFHAMMAILAAITSYSWCSDGGNIASNFWYKYNGMNNVLRTRWILRVLRT